MPKRVKIGEAMGETEGPWMRTSNPPGIGPADFLRLTKAKRWVIGPGARSCGQISKNLIPEKLIQMEAHQFAPPYYGIVSQMSQPRGLKHERKTLRKLARIELLQRN